jgi:TrmH family RNA methyltransferase
VNDFPRDPAIITSFNNPLVKRIKRLSRRKNRIQEGFFFIEGLRVVISAIEAQTSIDTLVYCPALLKSEIAWQSLEEQNSIGVDSVAVSEEVFRRFSSRENPVGMGAILPTSWSDIDTWTVSENDIFVGLAQVSEPGNLGTVFRTMDAVKGAGVILAGDSVDPFHPRSVKASMGAIFSLPVAPVSSVESLMTWARSQKLSVIASSAGANQSYWDAGYQLPALLLVGSERTGLSQDLLEKADMAVKIPMGGGASSLNLAVATGLLLYEIRRSRSFGDE